MLPQWRFPKEDKLPELSNLSLNGACHLEMASISGLLSVEMTQLNDFDTDNENSTAQQS